MVVVKRKKGESTESLISRFRRLAFEIVDEAREDRHKKPSEEKKERKYRLQHQNKLRNKREAA